MSRSSYEFEVLVRGKPCRVYHHDDGRKFIEGRKKSEFTLRVKNNTHGRIMACISVDGLSVMDGKDARVDAGGYIVKPYHYIDIPGWRLTDDQVAKFFFAGNHGGEGGTYAAQMDKPKNVGVIGCVIYREHVARMDFAPSDGDSFSFCGGVRPQGIRKSGRKRPSVTRSATPSWDGPDEQPRGITTANYCGDVMKSTPQRIGTGFGDAQNHSVRTVNFNNEPEPVARFTIFYDDRKGLEEKGVDLRQQKTVAVPDAWPGDRGCAPPPGWRG